MKKHTLFLFILALSLNSCSSQTERSERLENGATKATTEVIDQPTWESKVSEVDAPQIIDVRTAEEFSEGHLENALNIDFYSPDFRNLVADLEKEQPVFVYCRSGGRSAKAAKLMNEEGFSVVYDLKGGYLSWK